MKIVKIRWLVEANYQLSPLDLGGSPVLANLFAKSLVCHCYGAIALLEVFEKMI